MEKFSHSAHKTRVYRIWQKMRSRCNNPEAPGYQYYGGRGITVCDRWDYSFEYFLEDMGEPPEGYTLDRIDVNKGYSKENCRWASPKQQQNNRRCNVLITIDGETHTASEWAEIKGLNPGTVRERIRRGWTPEEALLPKLKSRHDRPKIRELGILQEPGERYGNPIDYEPEKTRSRGIIKDFEAMGPKMGEQAAETLGALMAMMEGQADKSQVRGQWEMYLYTALNFAEYCQKRFEQEIGEPDIMPALLEIKKHLRAELPRA